MFHHGNILACAPLGTEEVMAVGHFNTGTFRHGDFSAREIFSTRNFHRRGHFGTGYFGTWKFGHMDILAPCKAIWTFWHRHFGTCATVPKCPCAEMSPCQTVPVQNIPLAKNSSCQKVPMSKRYRVETSICRKVRSAERCTCRNVPMMKHPCQNDSCRNLRCRNGGKPNILSSNGKCCY